MIGDLTGFVANWLVAVAVLLFIAGFGAVIGYWYACVKFDVSELRRQASANHEETT